MQNISGKFLKELYTKGENISAYLKGHLKENANSEKIIELSYDLQSGSYIQQTRQDSGFLVAYAECLQTFLKNLKHPQTMMEAGVGEATTLSHILESFGTEAPRFYGFDLCWSRILTAKKWLVEKNHSAQVELTTGSLFSIPFQDNSIDIVYTSHSIEPNGGKEEPILKELYRVARDYVVLLEPGYEFATKEGKARMGKHGYCRDLAEKAKNLGYKVIHHNKFPVVANPLNPTAMTIIEKLTKEPLPINDVLACPIHRTPLIKLKDCYYSPEALMAYPILGSIPCLRPDLAIVASKMLED